MKSQLRKLRGLMGIDRRCGLLRSFTLLMLVLAGCTGVDDSVNGGSSAPIPAPADVKAPPGDAQTTPSGLVWKVLTPGPGNVHPSRSEQVTVHYTGWTTNGVMFDSSVQRGTPATFALNGVIAGWTEGVQLMVAGERSRFWIPAALAYGNNPTDGRPAGMLVFDIELLKIGR